MSVGENIKKYRKRKKITQTQLADKIKEVSLTSIQRYERGERQPNIEVIGLIANALDISTAELISSPEDYSEDIRPFVPASFYKGKEYTDNLFSELLSIEKQIKFYENNSDFNSLINGFSNYIELLKNKIEKTQIYHKQKELELLIENVALKERLKQCENK